MTKRAHYDLSTFRPFDFSSHRFPSLPLLLLGVLGAVAVDPLRAAPPTTTSAPAPAPRVQSATDWQPIGRGLTYREYVLEGPIRAYVARADRSDTSWTIEAMTSMGEIKGGRETVPGMVERVNDSVTFDGHRYDVKVAINGDYFNMRTGYATNGQIMGGWYAKRYLEYAGSGFIWTSDRECYLGGDVLNGRQKQSIRFADGKTVELTTFNDVRPEKGLALYTAQYAANTGTTPDGAEVVVHLDTPLTLVGPDDAITGRITQIRDNQGSTPMRFDEVVLSAGAASKSELLASAKVGQDVKFVLTLQDMGIEHIGLAPAKWLKAYASIGGPKCVLVNGVVPRDWEAKAARYAAEGRKHGSVVQDPRTGIAFDDRYVYFFIIDGRYTKSLGMTFTQSGQFCAETLGARNAVLQDGGGSSVIWINGTIRNHPSGKPGTDEPGELRPVANGYCIATVLPPEKAATLKPGDTLAAKTPTELRLGPGANYAVLATAPAGEKMTVLSHRLNGIKAKGVNWWFCRTKAGDGWVGSPR